MIILLGDLTAYTVANADEISAKAVAQGTMTQKKFVKRINENVSGTQVMLAKNKKREWLMCQTKA